MRASVFSLLLVFALGGNAMAVTNDDWVLAYNPGRPSAVSSGSMTGGDTVYLRRTILPDDKTAIYNRGAGRDDAATLERVIPAAAWRGKRLRLTLRLKNEDKAHGFVLVRVEKENDTGIVTQTQRNTVSNAWQTHIFVFDVPQNATRIAVDMRSMGYVGTVWVDEPTLEDAGTQTPTKNWLVDFHCTRRDPGPCDAANPVRRLAISWQRASS
jgi:hypothetical protein